MRAFSSFVIRLFRMTYCLDICPTCEGINDEGFNMLNSFWELIVFTADDLPEDVSWKKIDQLSLFKSRYGIADDVECSLEEALDMAIDPSQYPCTCVMDLSNDRVVPHGVPVSSEPCTEECPW